MSKFSPYDILVDIIIGLYLSGIILYICLIFGPPGVAGGAP